MIELNLQQGTPAWHAARAKCFTASEAPAMMGVSKYKTRSALIAEKATGIIPEVDATTQARFDMGHMVEALARPIVEQIIGEELYPIVATDDTGKYLASSDGATMLVNVGFEHKLWNEKLAAEVSQGNVPESHRWQLDQLIMVFGFEKIIFVVSDGTPEKMVHCWYYPHPERIASLIEGWSQFEKDVAAYVPEESKPAAVAEVIDDLPALTVQLVGQVTASNLADYKAAVTARIQAINTTLVTDNDFATADKMVKFLDDGEKRLDLVKSQALAQTSSIDELFRTIDSLKAEMRSKRLTLDKLVKAEKENRKSEIVMNATKELAAHTSAIYSRIQVNFFVPFNPAEAIKGLKSLDSMRDKVSVALANAKIEANAIADRIEANRKTVDDMSLFPDFAQVCTKPADDFAALLAMRIGQRKEAEEKRLAAERERIRAEEQAKAQREAAEKAEADKREANAKAAAIQAEQDRINTEAIRKMDEERRAAQAQAAADTLAALPKVGPVCVQESAKSETQPILTVAGDTQSAAPTLKLGEINARLGYTVSAEFLASLGFVATTERSAKLYQERDFSTICRKIADHTLALAFRKAA